MTRPVRLRLSRAKGFDLQAHSRAVNGLDAVNCARPGPFGNPFTVQSAAEVHDCRTASAHSYAVRWFRQWMEATEGFGELGAWGDTKKRRDAIIARLPDLRGKNLACFCKPHLECHADVLLELANPPSNGPTRTMGADRPDHA